MVNIIVVSHLKKLAESVVEFVEEMRGSDFKVVAISGIDGDEKALGSDPLKILAAINELYTEDGVLLLADIGSSVMNIELALDMLSDEMKDKVKFADAPLVEGALAAVAFNSPDVSLERLLEEAESARSINKR